jgi:protease I
MTRTALMLTAEQFEDAEVGYLYYRLIEAGYEVRIATPHGEPVEGIYGYEYGGGLPMTEIEPEAAPETFDLLVLPGGRAAGYLHRQAPHARELVEAFVTAEVPVAAIGAGMELLLEPEWIEGREVVGLTEFETRFEEAGAVPVAEEVVADGVLLTGLGRTALPRFTERLFELERPAAPPTA